MALISLAFRARVLSVDSLSNLFLFAQTFTPNFLRRRVIDSMSASKGRFEKRIVSSVRRQDASNGKAAFFAPLMKIWPFKALPPIIRMLSINQTKKFWRVGALVSSVYEGLLLKMWLNAIRV